jgi:hypothetical protein
MQSSTADSWVARAKIVQLYHYLVLPRLQTYVFEQLCIHISPLTSIGMVFTVLVSEQFSVDEKIARGFLPLFSPGQQTCGWLLDR